MESGLIYIHYFRLANEAPRALLRTAPLNTKLQPTIKKKLE